MYILFSVFISVGFISAFIAVRLTKKTLPGITNGKENINNIIEELKYVNPI